MQATELIKILQQQVETKGDAPVHFITDPLYMYYRVNSTSCQPQLYHYCNKQCYNLFRC